MRNFMLRCLFLLCLAITLQRESYAQSAPDSLELVNLLNQFLSGASRNDASVHDMFWAEDLIYTGSSGRRITKADIMRDVSSAPAAKPDDPMTTYTAEDVRIHQYDNMAVVAFKLVGTTVDNGTKRIANFLNTGTFLKRDGKWGVVSWQATRKPKPEEELKKEVSESGASLCRALVSSDKKQLESLTAESFIMMDNGRQTTRNELLDKEASPILKHLLPESDEPVISVYGDAAIIRYTSEKLQVESAMIAFINYSGEWKAITMNINQPKK